jgi:acyl transferase domain-containing protein
MKRMTGAWGASLRAGRGLLDIRLPRATPTWTARLDGRHMAFLKDHKVDSHVIFPAAGFVDLVLEAGLQLFEGRAFVVEDFEIRKPLILPDPASGVHLEISYEANERTFAIQSRFDQGTCGHCTSSARYAANARNRPSPRRLGIARRPAGTQPVEVEGFYRYMSDLGLRYGEEFRPIRELSAGGVTRRAAWRCPNSSPHAPVNTRCIRCSSTALCKPSPRALRPLRIAARG